MRKDWEVKKLGDLSISLKNGLTIKQDKSGCGIPITRIETLSNGVFNRDKLGYANIYDKEQYCDYILDNKDLLISHINSKQYVGRTVLYRKMENEYIIHGMNLLRLKLNEELTLPEFIVYNFKSSYIKEQIRKYRKDAVNQSSISINDIKKIKLLLPPLQTQQQIVEELDCLTSIIEKQKKQLEELDNLAQAVFYDMFGDPIENEKGWEVKKMDNICNITSSKRIYSHEYVETGIPFYRGKEITEKCKSLNLSVELFISVEKYEELKENFGVPQIGDLLLTAVGTIGNIWIVDTETPFYFKDGNILWLKNIVNTNPIFFKFLLELQISEFKNKLANGCAYNALTIMNLKILNVIIPPLSLQQDFASKIEAIEKQKELIKKSIKETEDLFNSRMDYYFN